MAELQQPTEGKNTATTGHARQVSTASTAPGDAIPVSSGPPEPAAAAESQAADVSMHTDIPVPAMDEPDTIPAASRSSAGTDQPQRDPHR